MHLFKIKLFYTIFLSSFLILATLFYPIIAYAVDCSGPLGCPPAGVEEAEGLFARILNISVGAAFVALLVVLVIAGIKYITSGGDAKSLGAAHQAIVWGLLGILFMALAWLVLQLIIAFTGVELLNSFNLRVLPQP